MLKKYDGFVKESRKSEDYKFGCVLLQLEIPNWEKILSSINKEDVYKIHDESYSLQKFPHITSLYGIHSDVKDSDVIEIINKYKYKDFDIEATGISSFSNKDFDVIKFGVKLNETLQGFHDELSKLPNSDEFPTYIPHITIAYLQPGTAQKYIDPNYPLNLSIKAIRYSKTNGQKLFFSVY